MAGILFFGVRGLLALIPSIVVRYPIKKWAAAVAILGAFGYAVIAGATIPTQRAFPMIGLVLLAVILDRQGISMRMVAWAAAIILLFEPESLLSASFFAAVIALIAAYEVFQMRRFRSEARTGPLWRAGLYFAGIAMTTIVASAATAPFAIFHFNRVAVFGLVANLIAVPLTALWIMPLAVVAFALMPFGIEGLALALQGWGISAVIWAAETVAGWSGAVVAVPAAPVAVIAAISIGGLWLCLWRGRWRLAGAAPILAGVIGFAAVTPPDILVEGSGKLFAIRTADGNYSLSSKRAARFSGEIWLRRVGVVAEDTVLWPRRGVTAVIPLRCDQLGCVYRAKGKTIALVRDPRALADDCRRIDIVVSAVPVRSRCPSAEVVIDRFDLWREGAHAIWLRGDGHMSVALIACVATGPGC